MGRKLQPVEVVTAAQAVRRGLPECVQVARGNAFGLLKLSGEVACLK